MSNELNETSHSIGVLDGKIDSVLDQLKTLSDRITTVYDKQVLMNGSIAKAHWRQDETDKKIAVNEDKLIKIEKAVNDLTETKKKVMWTIGGVGFGGGVLGSKLSSWFAGLL